MNLKVLRNISYGMYVIATKYNDRNVGCFVNTVTQITSENPIISVSVNKSNFTNEALMKTKKFTVSILSEKTSPEIIGKFGFFSSRDIDKFKDINYKIEEELPLLEENICGNLVCEVLDVIDCETHNIFLARVIDAEKNDEDLVPMTYKYYHEVIKGTAPKTAPTYIDENSKEEKQMEEAKKFKCKICGHIYDEGIEGVKFADLPEDWKCPLCGVGKELFEEIA